MTNKPGDVKPRRAYRSERRREQAEETRQRLQLLMVQALSAPLAEWLVRWPSTGGSSFERLQLALRRIPEAVQQVDALLRARAAAGR